MKKIVVLALLFVCVTKVYADFNYNQKFWINGTAFPFPLNYSISDLEIKGDITEVSVRSYLATIRFGEESKDKLISKRDYIFENGRLEKLKVYEPNDHFGGEFTFYYNSQNRLIRAVFKDSPDDTHPMELTYSYDDKGRVRKVDYVNIKGDMIGRWVIEYSTNKNFKISEYGAWTGELSCEFFYVNGLLIKGIYYYSSGKEASTCFYTYNSQRKLIKESQGRRLETHSYNAKGWDAKYNYTIDSKGNWTMKREKAKPGEYYELTERSITYKY